MRPRNGDFQAAAAAELISKIIAAHHAIYLGDRETFEETLRRLTFERVIPREAANIFHTLRKVGNKAVHEAAGNHADALSALKFARQLGIWFFRTYHRQPEFSPGPFRPPAIPVDATATLRMRSIPRKRVIESESEAARARQDAMSMHRLATRSR